MTNVARVAISAAVALLAGARPSPGQAESRDAVPALGLRATREALEARAARLEQAAHRPELGNGRRADAEREAAALRTRLTDGDLQMGDRVLLAVEGEKELSDTFPVGPGRALTLPGIGDVPLAGVLRSELQAYLVRRLAQNLRDPVVRARALVRLSIQGAVARPGYYAVPAEALVSDALMSAGGPTAEAQLDQLRIERGGKAIWQGKPLQQAIAEGRTIDGAMLVAGDEYVVPRRGRINVGETLRFGVLVLSVPLTIYSLTRIF